MYIKYGSVFLFFPTWDSILLQECSAPKSWQDSGELMSMMVTWLPPQSSSLDHLWFCTAGVDKGLRFSLDCIFKFLISSFILQIDPHPWVEAQVWVFCLPTRGSDRGIYLCKRVCVAGELVCCGLNFAFCWLIQNPRGLCFEQVQLYEKGKCRSWYLYRKTSLSITLCNN